MFAVNDSLDDILDESGDEEEQDAVVSQVLDEIGIEISGKVCPPFTASASQNRKLLRFCYNFPKCKSVIMKFISPCLLSCVYTMQPVVQPAVQPLEQKLLNIHYLYQATLYY